MSLTVRERNAPRPSDVVFDLAVGRPVLKEGLRRVRLFFGKLAPTASVLPALARLVQFLLQCDKNLNIVVTDGGATAAAAAGAGAEASGDVS
jgi:hypothetical protein